MDRESGRVSVRPSDTSDRASNPIVAALMLLTVGLSGCDFGPSQMQRGHLAYNEALRAAGDDEILLNIVRLRYQDTVEFLAISSISSQLSFTVSVGGDVGDTNELGHIGRGSGEVSYSARPTFTFVPQRSSEFARRLMEAVPIDTLASLAVADWDLSLLLRLLVRSMNDEVNEIGQPNPEFIEIARELGGLQNTADLFVGFVEREERLSDPIDEGRITGTDVVEAARAGYRFSLEEGGRSVVLTTRRPQPVIGVRPGAEGAEEILRALELPVDGRLYYDINEGTYLGVSEIEANDDLRLSTRSLLGAILYLSNGVEVPAEHVESGLTTEAWPPGAGTIDDLFRVRVSESQPDARLSVRYRGYWFYVDERDAVSRRTFMHAAELFRLGLLRETSTQSVPVLTLPVGAP